MGAHMDRDVFTVTDTHTAACRPSQDESTSE